MCSDTHRPASSRRFKALRKEKTHIMDYSTSPQQGQSLNRRERGQQIADAGDVQRAEDPRADGTRRGLGGIPDEGRGPSGGFPVCRGAGWLYTQFSKPNRPPWAKRIVGCYITFILMIPRQAH